MDGGLIRIKFPARPYQRELIDYFRNGGRNAYGVWHRRAGKDRTATFIESELACKRVGLYWHALPEYQHARRVIWDNITGDGQKLIDINFPAGMVRRRHEQDMKIELINGSIWQLVGADNFNALVGSNPVHVTFSEFALMHPKAREFIRPILTENNGTALYITTPRGYNHAHDLWQHAKNDPNWYARVLTVEDTGVIDRARLEEERSTMPEELFRQEYLCDWSAANVGAILGRYVETAEKEGRVTDEPLYDPDGADVEISSDIGFRDTATFWFWQPRPDGFSLIDYDEDTGLDAEDWIERLQGRYPYGTIWLPHDARAKTFATKRSVSEQFQSASIAKRVAVVPQQRTMDRINAARIIMPRCRFQRTKCAAGLAGLRAWQYKFDTERKTFSKEPDHDWASHPGDGFSYGASMMKERILAPQPKPIIPVPARTIGEWISMAERKSLRQSGRI
jgi:phage terminase large subunit